jgi:hypothetical protein
MTQNDISTTLDAPSHEGDEWEKEIEEAAEARRQKLEWIEKNPRPAPRAMMQRSPAHLRIPSKARYTTPTTPIDTTAKS